MYSAKTKNTRKKRTKLASRQYRNYSDEMLELAVDMVQNNRMSSREAEKRFGIPRRTILNKIRKIHLKPAGGQKKLTDEEEEKLANVLLASADYGSPMTKMDVKMLVYKYVEKNSRTDLFDDKLPSDTWVAGFLHRNRSKLTIRTTQNIKKVRAEKGLEEMEQFYANLSETLNDVPPMNILNYDETNLSDNPGTSKCVFRRGVKHPERILNSTKGCISIMFTACAAGACLPTYVVYKSSNLYSEWIEGGPAGTRYNCSKSGWFDTASFEDYFKTIVVEWAKRIPGPKVVIGDNLSSHINIEVVELCQKHNIRMVFLPPNSTHLTQPLDVAYFGPLKREWKKILLDYKLKNPGQSSLNKKHFPKLLAQLLENMKHKESNNIISGFRATGIWPVNPRNVFKRIPEYLDDSEYGIDTALLDYLKESRAAKPMQLKRSKKLHTEPGKSVCADDISTQLTARKNKSVKKNTKEATIKTNQERDIEDIMAWDTENEIYLNEITGEVIEKKGTIEYDMPSTSFGIIGCGEPALWPQFSPVIYNPARLDALSIKIINMHLGLAAHYTNDQQVDVCVLNKSMKSCSQNRLFVAHDENDTPGCLRTMTNIFSSQPKVIITSDVRVTPKEMMDIKKKIRLGTETIGKSALQMKIVAKKVETNKRKQESVNTGRKVTKRKKLRPYYCETSSESDILSIANTDDSEYETFDEYLSTCLQEIEKENFDPENSNPPFGLGDIRYFTNDVKLKEEDWVIVKFATKKSVKHFVGRVLYLKNSIPTVKFTRKVKNAKGGKVIFSYPNVEDVCDVNVDDVEIVLPPPNISRRGQIMFDFTFNPSYNIQ
ncbi:uncharacterized protein LOC123702030 [Colias croceus]|uniref:uncharacterized protein LOC123702030 n=1 Tax=Colias crocea TaxID=72248 RepID=UPI001E27C64B|nr:uncharacterized protein LOC123702030 [Colias croceus]